MLVNVFNWIIVEGLKFFSSYYFYNLSICIIVKFITVQHIFLMFRFRFFITIPLKCNFLSSIFKNWTCKMGFRSIMQAMALHFLNTADMALSNILSNIALTNKGGVSWAIAMNTLIMLKTLLSSKCNMSQLLREGSKNDLSKLKLFVTINFERLRGNNRRLSEKILYLKFMNDSRKTTNAFS